MLVTSLPLPTAIVHGYGGGFTNVGSFGAGATTNKVNREQIELVNVEGVLTGYPKNSNVKLITVYAPGCKKGKLILRELEVDEGKRSLFLSAPRSLAEKTKRATIYLKYGSQNLNLAERVHDRWIIHSPHWMLREHTNDNQHSGDALHAFSVKGFGSYWLVETESLEETNSIVSVLPGQSASQIVGGGSSRGFLLWALSAVIFCMVWIGSQCIHRTQRYGNV